MRLRLPAVIAGMRSLKMKMQLTSGMKGIELASRASTRHPSKAFKLLAAQGIQPLVTGRVLHKSGFVAESVIAVLSHAVEVRLVLSVVAASEAAILVEPSGNRRKCILALIFFSTFCPLTP